METDEHMETLFRAAKGSFCSGQPKIIFPSSEFLLNLICFSYIPLSTFNTSYFPCLPRHLWNMLGITSIIMNTWKINGKKDITVECDCMRTCKKQTLWDKDCLPYIHTRRGKDAMQTFLQKENLLEGRKEARACRAQVEETITVTTIASHLKPLRLNVNQSMEEAGKSLWQWS